MWVTCLLITYPHIHSPNYNNKKELKKISYHY